LYFMKKKQSKNKAKEIINQFFEQVREKTPKEVKKIKRLAMQHNIKLGGKKRAYCSKCLRPYIEPSIRIKNDRVYTTCGFCSHVAKWKFVEDQEIMPLKCDEEHGECC